jgi:hypothetical protein
LDCARKHWSKNTSDSTWFVIHVVIMYYQPLVNVTHIAQRLDRLSRLPRCDASEQGVRYDIETSLGYN